MNKFPADRDTLMVVMTDVLVAFAQAGGSTDDALNVVDYLTDCLESAKSIERELAKSGNLQLIVNTIGEA